MCRQGHKFPVRGFKIIELIGLLEKFSFVSTGGGAMLDYIVDGQLVGLDALKDRMENTE